MQLLWSEKTALPRRLMSLWILGFWGLKSGKERCLVTLITGPVGFLVLAESTRSGCPAKIWITKMVGMSELTSWKKKLWQPM